MGRLGVSLNGELFDKFLSIFLYILFLVLVTEVLWSTANFAWNPGEGIIDTEKILGLPPTNIADEITGYAGSFDPYSSMAYVLFFGACILIFYLVFGIFSCKGLILRKKVEELKRKKSSNSDEIRETRMRLRMENEFSNESDEKIRICRKLGELLNRIEKYRKNSESENRDLFLSEEEKEHRKGLAEIIKEVKEDKRKEKSEEDQEIIEKLEKKLKTVQELDSEIEKAKQLDEKLKKEEHEIQNLKTKSKELIAVVLILLVFDIPIFVTSQSSERARDPGFMIAGGLLLISQQYLILRDPKFRSGTTWKKASLLISCFLILVTLLFIVSSKSRGQLASVISSAFRNPSEVLNVLMNLSDETVKLLLGLTIHFVLLLYCVFKVYVWISEREKAKKSMMNYLRSHSWSIGAVFCLVSVYILLCFLLSEIWKDRNLLGVVMLLLISTLISLGLFFDGFIMSRVLDKNNGILEEIGLMAESNTDHSGVGALIDKLRNHINSLLINLLAAVISYLFLSAVLCHLLPNKDVISVLVILLYIPFYIFFYGSFLDVMRIIYQYIYSYIERASDLSRDETRRDSVVNLFWRLTRVGIIIVIVFHLLHVVQLSDKLTGILSPFKEILTVVIAVPLGFWILVVVLDPFFEKEIVEVGSERGEIIRIGPFFTKLETMTGEKIYVPNAELIARTVKRLNRREPSDKYKEYRERWILISFSCTLSYDYSTTKVQGIFRKLFIGEVEKEKRRIRNYLEEIGFEQAEEEIESIFLEGARTFMSVDDFKDHGITYRFNFRMKDSLYASLFKNYFMKRFKEEMENAEMHIATPLKFEMNEL
jgi:hypothetical protein